MFSIPTSTGQNIFDTVSQLWSDMSGAFILAVGIPVFFLILRIIIRALMKTKERDIPIFEDYDVDDDEVDDDDEF